MNITICNPLQTPQTKKRVHIRLQRPQWGVINPNKKTVEAKGFDGFLFSINVNTRKVSTNFYKSLFIKIILYTYIIIYLALHYYILGS